MDAACGGLPKFGQLRSDGRREAATIKVLTTDMRLNMALPCRISVYTEQGKTKIGMIKPIPMLAALSQDASLVNVAQEVEAATRKMIDESR